MKSRVQEKGTLQKLLAVLIMLALTIVMLGLPMFTQTVKADEQVKIEISYLYVNAAGENSSYLDTQYVPAGTTWGDFFANYQKCYNGGVITDANPENQWTQSVQRTTYQDETACYGEEIKNFNQYSDCALVDIYGIPASYKEIGIDYGYFVDGEALDGGAGWSLLLPSSYAYGSPEAIDYIKRNIGGACPYIAGLCSEPGVTAVEIEPYYEATDEWRLDLYEVQIFASSQTPADDSASQAVSDTTAASAESTYADEGGATMRRIAAEGNGTVALDGAAEILPAGSRFTCAQLTSGDAYTRAAEIVSGKVSGMTAFKVFDMNLMDASNAAIHQLNGYINVTLPIPDGMSAGSGKVIMVYRIEDDGTLTQCVTATKDGYLTFATNHFSTYVIVEQSAVTSPKTSDANVNAVFAFAMFAVAAGVCSACVWRKKSVRN